MTVYMYMLLYDLLIVCVFVGVTAPEESEGSASLCTFHKETNIKYNPRRSHQTASQMSGMVLCG